MNACVSKLAGDTDGLVQVPSKVKWHCSSIKEDCCHFKLIALFFAASCSLLPSNFFDCFRSG